MGGNGEAGVRNAVTIAKVAGNGDNPATRISTGAAMADPLPPDNSHTLPATCPGEHRCANCGSLAPGKFCPECGQETRLALPTAREMIRDAAGRVVAWDGRTWRTLYVLLFRPGVLTTEYLRGRRKRYVRPARLAFVTAILLFGTMRVVNTPVGVVTVSMPDRTDPQDASRAKARPTPGAKSADGSPADLQIDFGTVKDDAHPGSQPGDGKLHVDVDESFDRLAARVDGWLPVNTREHFARFRQLTPSEQSAQVYSACCATGPTRWSDCCRCSRCCRS